MGASKLLHRILKFINYANLCKFIQNQWKMPPLLFRNHTRSALLAGAYITHRVIYYPLVHKLWKFMQIYSKSMKNATSPLYAVKVQRSLAPLSWFPGSRKPTAHVHKWCTFQSYAKSRRLHAIANEIYKWNLHCVNRILGIHDNGPPRSTLWRLTLTAYSEITPGARFIKTYIWL